MVAGAGRFSVAILAWPLWRKLFWRRPISALRFGVYLTVIYKNKINIKSNMHDIKLL